MPQLRKVGIKSVRNTIIETSDGERIDLRKVDVGKVRRQKQYGLSKYGSRSADFQGVTYHSTAEARYAQQLELQKKGKMIKDWKRQYKIPLKVFGQLITTYYADFLVIHNDNTQEIIEVKGYFTDYARLKWKLFTAIFEQEYPEIKITMVKV